MAVLAIRAATPIPVLRDVIEQFPTFSEAYLSGFEMLAERTDPDLAAAVLNALKWDAVIPTDKVDVTVSKGWVTLKGENEELL